MILGRFLVTFHPRGIWQIFLVVVWEGRDEGGMRVPRVIADWAIAKAR